MAKLGVNLRSWVVWPIIATLIGLVLPLNTHAALFTSDTHPLPADQAFVLEIQQSNHNISMVWTIADDYYLYQDKLAFSTSNQQDLDEVTLPPAIVKQDPVFGTTKVYFNQLHLTGVLPLDTSADQPATSLTVFYQGCWNGGVCYPPQSTTIDLAKVVQRQDTVPLTTTDTVDWSQTSGTNAHWFLQNLQHSDLATLLVIFFVAGLALAFTPCVLPMVPILSSIIVGLNPKPGPLKSFFLSLIYVLAMAVTYSLAGLVAGLSGANVQIALQHPVVISATATLFVIFALAMFGLINVQMPQAVQNKINTINNKQLGGQYSGVAIMGVLSALVVGPCVAAPLAGALLFIGQAGEPATGALALFTMGMGMGVPLLLVGTSASKWIPKTGPWMSRVKVGFGFLMLLMALWMTDRIWPQITPYVGGLIAIAMALILGLHYRWRPTLKTKSASVISYTLAMFLGCYGGNLIIQQMVGTDDSGLEQSEQLGKPGQLDYSKVLAESVEPLLLQAKIDQQPVILDFYADWCISCKELDSFVFTDAKVQSALANYKVIKVDVTTNSPAAKELMQSLSLVGPPALVLYDRAGNLTSEIVIGVPKIDDLVSLLKQVEGL